MDSEPSHINFPIYFNILITYVTRVFYLILIIWFALCSIPIIFVLMKNDFTNLKS